MQTTREELERHINIATYYARAEIISALRAPQRALINCISQRAACLKIQEEELSELEEYVETTHANEEWGMF
jgi:predicted secreted Zn-dependent protease